MLLELSLTNNIGVQKGLITVVLKLPKMKVGHLSVSISCWKVKERLARRQKQNPPEKRCMLWL